MSTIDDDAREYGEHVKHGGWRLALLVARNVEKRSQGGDTRERRRDHVAVATWTSSARRAFATIEQARRLIACCVIWLHGSSLRALGTSRTPTS
jgi:short subunit dehydrogenase-like uncharacterized protein